MILDWSKVKVFVKPGPTDMRKQINGLSMIVSEDLEMDPFLCGGPRYVTGGAHPHPGRR